MMQFLSYAIVYVYPLRVVSFRPEAATPHSLLWRARCRLKEYVAGTRKAAKEGMDQ